MKENIRILESDIIEIISPTAQYIWACDTTAEAREQLAYVRDVLGYKDAYIYDKAVYDKLLKAGY